jgi:hypothetical protein
METLQISTKLMNGVIGYLGTRPYQEVHQLIQAIQTEATNQPKPDADQPKPDAEETPKEPSQE